MDGLILFTMLYLGLNDALGHQRVERLQPMTEYEAYMIKDQEHRMFREHRQEFRGDLQSIRRKREMEKQMYDGLHRLPQYDAYDGL